MPVQRAWLLAFVALTVVSAASLAYYYSWSGERTSTEVTTPTPAPLATRVIRVGVFSSTQSNYPIYKFLADEARRDFNDFCNRTGVDARLEVTLGDAEGQPANAKQFTIKCYQAGIRVVVGFGWSSFFCSSAYTYANSEETPMIIFSPSSTSPSYHTVDNVFRLCEDEGEASKVAVQLLKERGIKSLVVIARNDSWADLSFETYIEPLFTGLGGEIEGWFAYPPDIFPNTMNSDSGPDRGRMMWFESRIASAEAAVKQAMADHPGEVGVLLLAFDEASYILNATSSCPSLLDVPWFGLDGTANTPMELATASEAAERVILLSPKLRNPESELGRRLNERFLSSGMTAGVGEENVVDFTNANIYDCVMLAALAQLRANTTDVATLRETIPMVASAYTGATGPVILDETGDRIGIDYDIWGHATGGAPAIFGRYDATTETFTWDQVVASP